MYPYMYDGSFLALALMVVLPLAALAVFAWIVANLTHPPETTAKEIARERFARGEISQEELGVLLQTL